MSARVAMPLSQLLALKQRHPNGPWRHARGVGDSFMFDGHLVTVEDVHEPTPTKCRRVQDRPRGLAMPATQRSCEGCGVAVWLCDHMPPAAIPYCPGCIALLASDGEPT